MNVNKVYTLIVVCGAVNKKLLKKRYFTWLKHTVLGATVIVLRKLAHAYRLNIGMTLAVFTVFVFSQFTHPFKNRFSMNNQKQVTRFSFQVVMKTI